MRIVTSATAMQRTALRWRRQGIPVGLVPTMGYLHAGHTSLMRRARQAVGKSGVVVVSIYVNPKQFGPHEDLSRYPRDFQRDKVLCRNAGVDVIFVPSDEEMYPDKETDGYSTYVVEESLSKRMEGTSRPTHFRGVTTVVAKLFNLVLPTVAIFGLKDFQQAAVVRRMVRDLNFPVRVISAPIVREEDGLAMSSRNKYLSKEERMHAVVLHTALLKARRFANKASNGYASHELKRQLKRMIEAGSAVKVDYIEAFDPATLEPASKARRGVQVAMAVFVGKTRLIDNIAL